MSLQLAAPLEEDFSLTKTDEAFQVDTSTPTTIRVKQASQAATERRDKLFSDVTRVFEDQDKAVQLRQNLSLMELMRIEVFLTLVDSNITDEQGKPLFRFVNVGNGQRLDMDENSFSAAWGQLPPLVCNEIHEKVMLVNVTWRPQGEGS